MQKDGGRMEIIWTGPDVGWTWFWQPIATDDDDRDDDWPEDFERYMKETGWLMEGER